MVAATSNDPESSAQEDTKTASPPPPASWASRLIRQAKWRAHWLMPNTVPPPHGGEKAYHARRDRESNEASRIPEDEQLRLSVVWGVELFGPAEVESLYDSLRRLNWTSGIGRSKEDGALTWVRHQREYGGAGSWYNVGLVTEGSDRGRLLMIDNYASMPEGVEHLLVRIFQLTPSLTSVLVGFVFKDYFAQSYAVELNRDRKTVRERTLRRSSISILDPGHLKGRSLELARSRTRDVARRWFDANLPGFFCGLPNDRMPTAELITTQAHHLFSEENDRPTSIHFGWRRLVSNSSRFDVWTYADCSGLRFVTGDRGRTKETPHLVVALCTSDVPGDALKHWGGHERHAYVAYCHERMDGILSNYAGLAFLRETSKDLKTSRAALNIGNVSRRKSVRALEQIQSFFDRSLGTPAVATELLDRSKYVSYYKHECARFLSPGWAKEEVQREYGSDLCEQTQFLASKVISEEHSMREHFEQLSSILSVRESVRAQRRMEWLTVVALALAAASLYAALPPMKDWPNQIKPYMEFLGLVA